MPARRQIHLKIPTAASAATGILTMDMVEVVVTVVPVPEVIVQGEPVLLDTARNMAATIHIVQENQALARNLLCSRIQP